MTKSTTLPDFLVAPGRGWDGLIAFLSLALAVNLLGMIIGVATQDLGWLALAFLGSVGIALAAYRLRRRSRLIIAPGPPESPTRRAGLIVLIGPGRPGPDEDRLKQPAWPAIQYHLSAGSGSGLRYCWMITPRHVEGAMEVAGIIHARCVNAGVEAKIVPIEDPFDVQETYNAVRHVYTVEAAERRLDAWQIIADFTGGVRPMTAGVVLAGGSDWPMQYMYGRAEGVPSVPRLIRFTSQ